MQLPSTPALDRSPQLTRRRRRNALSARVARDEQAIYLLVDVEGEKDGQIERFPFISCAWVDSGGHKYSVVSGPA
jgi:hypothetical protein